MRPLFSAIKTRPSLANRIAVGFVRPVNTVVSTKPEGTVLAPRVLPAGHSRYPKTAAATTVEIQDQRGTRKANRVMRWENMRAEPPCLWTTVREPQTAEPSRLVRGAATSCSSDSKFRFFTPTVHL